MNEPWKRALFADLVAYWVELAAACDGLPFRKSFDPTRVPRLLSGIQVLACKNDDWWGRLTGGEVDRHYDTGSRQGAQGQPPMSQENYRATARAGRHAWDNHLRLYIRVERHFSDTVVMHLDFVGLPFDEAAADEYAMIGYGAVVKQPEFLDPEATVRKLVHRDYQHFTPGGVTRS